MASLSWKYLLCLEVLAKCRGIVLWGHFLWRHLIWFGVGVSGIIPWGGGWLSSPWPLGFFYEVFSVLIIFLVSHQEDINRVISFHPTKENCFSKKENYHHLKALGIKFTVVKKLLSYWKAFFTCFDTEASLNQKKKRRQPIGRKVFTMMYWCLKIFFFLV